MRTNMMRSFATIALLAALSGPATAQIVDNSDNTAFGTSSAEFLLLGAGARGTALGGAYAALATDVTALYYNPAGVAQMGRPGAMDDGGRCFAAASPPPHAEVECWLLPHEAAVLAGPVRALQRGHPELDRHLPAGPHGYAEARLDAPQHSEHVLIVRQDRHAVVLVARDAAWHRLGAVRDRLRRGRCPDS